MDEDAFRRIVEEEWSLVPDRYQDQVRNVAILVEDEPSGEVRAKEGLSGEETLLGLYQGIPLTERGEGYGDGGVVPDTITIYRLPTSREADDLFAEFPESDFDDIIRDIIRDTLWHEIGHYFGLPEGEILDREDEGTNEYQDF